MQYYFEEPGLIYDCLLFLSLCYEKETEASNTFMEVKEVLGHNGVTVPEHLSPLFCRQAKHRSFLKTVLFDELEYSDCSFAKTERTINNLTYMKRKLAEFYFPGVSPGDLQQITQVEYPNFISLLKKESSLSERQADLMFILVHFDKAIEETAKIIGQVRAEMEKLHRQFVVQHEKALKDIQTPPVIEELRAVIGLPPDGSPVKYSLSLMDTERISFRAGEPDFFILGSCFGDALETRYKYRHVTPVSFIRALGSEAKCLIFEALLNMRPMSSADMETELHLSRNAVARNIKELRESGVVTVEHTEGLSYYYTLNKEYIGIVAEQLEQLKYQRNNSGTITGS